MTTKSNDIPVAVFAYKRPDLLQRLLASLKKDKVPFIYFFIDGAKNKIDEQQVKKVSEIIKGISWCEKEVYEQPKNLGLGKSIKYGVSLVLSKHKSIIVYEDDLVCVRGTYNYLSSALRYYEGNERVMSVTGWTHPKITPEKLENMPYFDGKAECWCWGTWASAWEGMEKTTLEIYNECILKGLDVEKYGTDMPKMALEARQKNLWAVGWWYLHILNEGLCLRPPYSLVETTGWDGRGTTITPEMQDWANPPLKGCPPIPTQFPPPIENKDCPNLWRKAIDGDKINENKIDLFHYDEMESLGEGIWIINNLLTKTESHFLILEATRNQFNKARNGEKYGRYNQETFLSDDDMLNLIRRRLYKKLSYSRIGLFRPNDTTPVLEFYHYSEGDYITRHQDAPISISESVKSTHTLVIYLNNNFKGGETYFEANNIQIKANTGCGILFQQSLNHEGKALIEGNKYILRLSISIKSENET